MSCTIKYIQYGYMVHMASWLYKLRLPPCGHHDIPSLLCFIFNLSPSEKKAYGCGNCAILEKRVLWTAHSTCILALLLVECIAAFVKSINLSCISRVLLFSADLRQLPYLLPALFFLVIALLQTVFLVC